MPKKLSSSFLSLMLGAALAVPSVAFALDGAAGAQDGASVSAEVAISESENAYETAAPEAALSGDAAQARLLAPRPDVNVSAEGETAALEGCSFAVEGFYRAQKGSNRPIDGTYRGYAYLNGGSSDYASAVAFENLVVVHVPQCAVDALRLDMSSEATLNDLAGLIMALDKANAGGYDSIDADRDWVFTSEESFDLDGATVAFNQEYGESAFYTTLYGEDGADITADAAFAGKVPTHVDSFKLTSAEGVVLVEEATGLAALGEFFRTVDMSPLWVTLKTTGVAIVAVFLLGILAAWWSLRIPTRAQDIFDTIFTIPMVLPPTVCGFILLMCLGNNSPVGRWFIDIGFPLIFSWPATVIAATVVAFPMMYRSARGAFESIDPNMLDAARTLGWSEGRIFFKLMLPLAWSSIAAGTVLAYARALGEFGATLFMAGNYVGITRTIPLAIYFEWMSGNTDVALFWTAVMLVFSFLVVLFINLWSRRTTKYRRREAS